MSHQLETAVKSILDMKYFKNENARSGGANYGHEAVTAEKIKLAGFTEIDKKQYPKITKSMLKKWARTGDDSELRKATIGMPAGSYILQPSGSQGFPDVLILDFNDRFISLECKSGKDGLCPMWNDSLPNPDTIYVLSSGKLDKTTIFLGKDVITDEEVKNQILFWQEVKLLEKKYKISGEPLDKFNRGWLSKGRPQNFQGGGNEKSNYFTHIDKEVCEKNAMELAKL